MISKKRELIKFDSIPSHKNTLKSKSLNKEVIQILKFIFGVVKTFHFNARNIF